MSRILNFLSYFFLSICGTATLGLISRVYPPLTPWFWVFLLLFLLTLIGLLTFYGRKAYIGILNTSESVLIGLSILLFVGVTLGAIAAYV